MRATAIARLFVSLNALNDFAYFGFLFVQFLILEDVLKRLLPPHFSALSVGFSIAMIASQLVWQVMAEGPTGAYADKFGRARAVAASFYCRAFAVTIVVATALLAEEGMPVGVRGLFVTAIVLAQVLVATGEAFLEGSIEAWLRDELKIASPNSFGLLVDRALGVSAITQNIAILGSTVTFVGLWDFTSGKAGTGLAILAGVLFLGGGVFGSRAASREQFVVRVATTTLGWRRVIQKEIASLWWTIRHAAASLLQTEVPAVRRLVLVLVLPFPCWILLSWFYPAFVQRAGLRANAALPASLLLWLGLALGLSRVVGAWWGERITRNEEGRDVQLVFERAVVANVALLFISGAVLFMVSILDIPAVQAGALFLAVAAAAKGSEEVVKLAKNRLLAVLVADASARATILSLVSIAQNAFGFATLMLAALLAIPLASRSEEQPVLMFWTCGALALLGVLITAIGRQGSVPKTNRPDVS